MNATHTTTVLDLDERDWCLSTRTGWFAMATTPPRTKPSAHTSAELKAMPTAELRRFNHARAVWHANLGPIRTPGIDKVFETVDEICGANRQDGDKVKPAVVLEVSRVSCTPQFLCAAGVAVLIVA